MANFRYWCRCGAMQALRLDRRPEKAPRCACGKRMRSGPAAPTSQVVEKLDNGAMVRPLERLADAERLYAERARNADPLAGGAAYDVPKSEG